MTTKPPVHPHARGERTRPQPIGMRVGGSSPRPWGTRRVCRSPMRAVRFIPTPVGNARWYSRVRSRLEVHPHARGERRRIERDQIPAHGSSPRPWGTLPGATAGRRRRRFIPTPVGNAVVERAHAAIRSVHPHARGERRSACTARSNAPGSSPRPWGTLVLTDGACVHARFIPTPVGNAGRA